MSSPRVLLYDLETTHNIAAIFRLFDDYTSHENILRERYIVSISWKWLGDKAVHAVSTLDNRKLYKRDPHNDRHVIETFDKVLETADVIVGHNADGYDLKFLEGRRLFHGMSPLPPQTTIDTLKIAKSRFLLNSNKLDYLAKYLGLGRKILTHNKWWLDIAMAGKEAPAAIRKMVEYNKKDVELLEKVFLKLRPYCANHINRELIGGTGCPRCGSNRVQSRGVHRAVTRIYNRFQCQDCGGWFRDQKNTKLTVTKRVL